MFKKIISITILTFCLFNSTFAATKTVQDKDIENLKNNYAKLYNIPVKNITEIEIKNKLCNNEYNEKYENIFFNKKLYSLCNISKLSISDISNMDKFGKLQKITTLNELIFKNIFVNKVFEYQSEIKKLEQIDKKGKSILTKNNTITSADASFLDKLNGITGYHIIAKNSADQSFAIIYNDLKNRQILNEKMYAIMNAYVNSMKTFVKGSTMAAFKGVEYTKDINIIQINELGKLLADNLKFKKDTNIALNNGYYIKDINVYNINDIQALNRNKILNTKNHFLLNFSLFSAGTVEYINANFNILNRYLILANVYKKYTVLENNIPVEKDVFIYQQLISAQTKD